MSWREQFQTIMDYGPVDHMPVLHWDAWPETLKRWQAEGMPCDRPIHEVLGTEPLWLAVSANLGLWPVFAEQTLEETAEHRIYRDGAGVVCQASKLGSTIPHSLDWSLKTPVDWEQFKKRLQPDPARIGPIQARQIAAARTTGLPVRFHTGSLMGWFRNWMGVENLGYFLYDHPDVFADMVQTMADLVCWAADQLLPQVRVDFGFGWEDICGRCGPFVSPDLFRRLVAPGYRQIRAKLEQYGVGLYGVDSDGDVSALVGPWLDAGVNLLFPLEPGTWHADGWGLRQAYGRELRIFGHFDKLALERGRDAVEAELTRLRPLLRDGGYVLMPDHLITPSVSWDMYRWYLERVRALRF